MTVKFVKVNHKIINENGWSLRLPGQVIDGLQHMSEPDIYTESTTQLYPLSTKLEFADGRVFRYAKWGATSTSAPLGRLLFNANTTPGSAATNGYEGSLDATSGYAVGATTIVLNDGTDRVENAYEDGLLMTFPTGHYAVYRIIGSEVATTVDDVTIYLETGLKTACVVNSTGVTATPSIFSNCQQSGSDTRPAVVGLTQASAMTSGSFGWVQRKGRAWVTPNVYFGGENDERLAYRVTDGTIRVRAGYGQQIVGYLTQYGVSYDDGELWLTLE